MKKNKAVLEHCPNFYKIANFDIYEDDFISGKLITLYKEFIFDIDLTNKNDVKTIQQLDFVINKYIEDYYFRKEMQRSLTRIKVKKTDNLNRDIIEGIIDCFDSYETGYTRNIYFARWI